MKKFLPLLALAPLSLLFTGCPSNEVMESKNIAQSEIHQGYFITYDESDGTMSVTAEFRAAGPNGTTLVLSEPSDARCNGEEMKLDTYILGGAYYSYNKSINWAVTTVTTQFIDLDKKTYENSFPVFGIGIDTQLSDLPQLQKNNSNRISLKTAPLKDGETLRLNIRGDSVAVDVDYPANAAIQIDPEKLVGFKPSEKVVLQFERTRTGKLPQATARGGTYTVTSRSAKMEATIH